MQPVFYAYEASYHCPAHTEARFSNLDTAIDNEGNPIYAVFSRDCDGSEVCDECLYEEVTARSANRKLLNALHTRLETLLRERAAIHPNLARNELNEATYREIVQSGRGAEVLHYARAVREVKEAIARVEAEGIDTYRVYIDKRVRNGIRFSTVRLYLTSDKLWSDNVNLAQVFDNRLLAEHAAWSYKGGKFETIA